MKQVQGHVTVFEMIELTVAIAVARWFAEESYRWLAEAWQPVAFWVIWIGGTLILFIAFAVTIGQLLELGTPRGNAPHGDA